MQEDMPVFYYSFFQCILVCGNGSCLQWSQRQHITFSIMWIQTTHSYSV